MPDLVTRRMDLWTRQPGQSAVAEWGPAVAQQRQRVLMAEHWKRTVVDWCGEPKHATETKRWLDQRNV